MARKKGVNAEESERFDTDSPAVNAYFGAKKEKDEGWKVFNIRIPQSLMLRVERACQKHGANKTEAGVEALKAWVTKAEKKHV